MDLTQMRVVRRYKKLLPAGPLDEHQKGLLSKMKGPNRLVICGHDIMRQSFLFQLLNEGSLKNIELLSAYDLIDIYLEKDTRYARLLDITPEVLCIYAGFGEFTNKRLEEAILQVAENQRVHKNQTWVFFKGTLRSLEGKYPQWMAYMKERKFQIMDVNKDFVPEEVEEI